MVQKVNCCGLVPQSDLESCPVSYDGHVGPGILPNIPNQIGEIESVYEPVVRRRWLPYPSRKAASSPWFVTGVFWEPYGRLPTYKLPTCKGLCGASASRDSLQESNTIHSPQQ